MKKMTKKGTMLTVLWTLSVLSLYGQEDHVRKYTENFSVSPATLLEVVSKYGDVEINNWNRDEVDIYAEVVLRDLTRQKADQVFQHVDIEIARDGNTIHVETRFDDEFFRLVDRNAKGGSGNFQIRYKIKLPATVKVHAENKYGDLFINELSSESYISVKYGNVKAMKLNGRNKDWMIELDLGYSNGSVESSEWLRVVSKYSKLSIEESKALIILSKYSKMNIERATSIVSESKYDTYNFGELANFVAEAQYSNFRFDKLYNKLILDTKYTDVRISSIPAGFEAIEIENSYGTMKLGIDANASYQLRGYAKYAKIDYPETGRVNRFQENTELRVEGLVGADKSATGHVRISTHYGGISLEY